MAVNNSGNHLKMVLVIRKDLNMRKGKMAAQAAHAAVSNIVVQINQFGFNTGADWYRWFHENDFEQRKITVSVNSESELLALYHSIKQTNLPVSLIVDHGLTEFNGVRTLTALAVGPAMESLIDPYTGHLPLL